MLEYSSLYPLPLEALQPNWNLELIRQLQDTFTQLVCPHHNHMGPIPSSDRPGSPRCSDRSYSGGSGPDGLSWNDLKLTRKNILSSIYNLWLYRTKSPAQVKLWTIILKPKEIGATNPATKMWPIIVTSVIAGLLRRLETALPSSQTQRGFKAGDGCSADVHLLQATVEEWLGNDPPQPLAMVFIVIKKAYDSVIHGAIIQVLCHRRVLEPLVQYANDLYQISRTRVASETSCTDKI